uniref:C2H2-type domain-containing protein n=1 Tax=Panagrellus redivivus TaxID=6233 RepID=A0A7E4V6Y1_PANRE
MSASPQQCSLNFVVNNCPTVSPSESYCSSTSSQFTFPSAWSPPMYAPEAERMRMIELEQAIVTEMLRIAVACRMNADTVITSTSPPASEPSPSQSVESKPHGCPECGKYFRFHSNLVEHRTVHFQGKTHFYACPLCPKRCRLKGNLKKHLHRHYSSRKAVDEVGNLHEGINDYSLSNITQKKIVF